MSEMKVVIDGDQMLYACGFAAEGEPLSHSLKLLKNAINEILKDCRTESYELYISGKDNFRDDIAVTQVYKGNRDNRKPEFYGDMVHYLISAWGAQPVNGMETDDMVSIRLWEDFVACGGDKDKATIILSSPDKDLKNTPGWHYNPRTKKLQWFTEEQSMRHFWFQMLFGDRVDHVKGLPYLPVEKCEEWGVTKRAAKGVGEASAKQIMSDTQTAEEAEKRVWEAYRAWGEDAGLDEEEVTAYFTEQANLLWMVRELNEFNEPVMWEMQNEQQVEAD